MQVFYLSNLTLVHSCLLELTMIESDLYYHVECMWGTFIHKVSGSLWYFHSILLLVDSPGPPLLPAPFLPLLYPSILLPTSIL